MNELGLFTPTSVALLTGLAFVLMWMAFAPSLRPGKAVDKRLDEFLTSGGSLEDAEMSQPFTTRLILPLLRRLLRYVGAFMPQRNFESIRRQLIQAGEPGNLSVLDFYGLRILLSAGLIAGNLIVGRSPTLSLAIRNVALLSAIGYMLPYFWLRQRARHRQQQIRRQLPDALDMLTISVEAGLAFESAMLRVGEQWQNELSLEFQRVVGEVRMGTARSTALQRMADRTQVDELSAFVAVLIQSNQLGVSIAHVLHSQAEQMRTKRRQMAEEQARQASVKMVLVMVILIFPVMFIAVLGPTIPLSHGVPVQYGRLRPIQGNNYPMHLPGSFRPNRLSRSQLPGRSGCLFLWNGLNQPSQTCWKPDFVRLLPQSWR